MRSKRNEARQRWGGGALGGAAFTLIEVMIAMSIVLMAVTTSYEVFYTVRRINARGRFYSLALVLARRELPVVMKAFQTTGDTSPVDTVDGASGIRLRIVFEAVPGLDTARKVTMTLTQQDRLGTLNQVVFRTYVSNVVEVGDR